MTPFGLRAYQRDLSQWLDEYEWAYWATFTSAFPRSVPSWRRFCTEYSDICGFDLMFWGAEADGTRPHVHALLSKPAADVQALCQKRGWSAKDGGAMQESEALWRLAAEMNGRKNYSEVWDPVNKRGVRRQTGKQLGRTHIDRFNPNKGAAYYVGKYVTKRLSDYDIFTR